MKIIRWCLLALIANSLFTACNTINKAVPGANPDTIGIRLQLVTDAVSVPVEVNAPPDGSNRRFITDAKGMIWILKNDSVQPRPFLDLFDRVASKEKNSSAGSIFSMAFHPQFAANGKCYVCYAAPAKTPGDPSRLVVSEFTVSRANPDSADLSSERRVIEFKGMHIGDNGARILFGPDGYLYISVADDQTGDTSHYFGAQDLSSLNGKLLRIDVNKTPYGIPADNPFIATKNARPEIWAFGFRKLWHYSFDTASHQLFGGDVGQGRVEETDIIKKGANYGWPVMEGDSSFKKTALTDSAAYIPPINSYTHKTGICVIGGAFYYGKKIPELTGKYVFGDFNGSIFALSRKAGGKWIRQPVKVVNKLPRSFFICGFDNDVHNDFYVMGIASPSKTGAHGSVYKIKSISD